MLYLFLLRLLFISKHVVFFHLILHSLPDLSELDPALAEGLSASMRAPPVLAGPVDGRLDPLHRLEQQVPGTHIQKVPQTMRDIQ
jgi:hypothetical protein